MIVGIGGCGHLVSPLWRRCQTKDDRDPTLRMANSVEEMNSRDRVRELRASTLSLMPEDLEMTPTPQDIADLLAFIQRP